MLIARHIRSSALALSLVAAFSATAIAEPQEIGRFTDWRAYVEGTDAKKICFIGSAPTKAEGKYTQRGQTYVLITHRPGDNPPTQGEVSVEAGYAFKPDSEVTVDIGGKTFKLFTRDGNAWARDPQQDKALVQAMRTGSEMVIKGTSSRGTLTTDTYSLKGFAAAYESIGKACGVN